MPSIQTSTSAHMDVTSADSWWPYCDSRRYGSFPVFVQLLECVYIVAGELFSIGSYVGHLILQSVQLHIRTVDVARSSVIPILDINHAYADFTPLSMLSDDYLRSSRDPREASATAFAKCGLWIGIFGRSHAGNCHLQHQPHHHHHHHITNVLLLYLAVCIELDQYWQEWRQPLATEPTNYKGLK